MGKKLIMCLLALGMCFSLASCAELFEPIDSSCSSSLESSTSKEDDSSLEDSNDEEEDLVTITFKQDGKETIVKTVEKGETLTDIPMPAEKTGYTVVWDKLDFTNISEDIIVTAIETANTYTVTYDANGGFLSEMTQEVTFDEETMLATPEKEDYVFLCWTYEGNPLVSGDKWKIDDNITLVASWLDTRPMYTVTFVDGNQTKEITVKKGESVSEVDVPLFVGKVGYSVVWDKTDYTNIQADMTVTAVYTANIYTVTYDADGFDIDGTTVELTYNAACTALDMTLSKEGYTFLGWKHGDITYTNTSVWNVVDNVTLTAEWVAKDQVVVTFIDTDGTTMNKSGYVGEDLTDIPTPKVKIGYTVDTENWYVDETCTIAATFTNLQDSATVYAKCTANTYTVTYKADGFSLDGTTVNLTYDEVSTALDMTLVQEGAIFLGWEYDDVTYTNESLWDIAANVTITAVWVTKDQVVISFVDTDGTTMNKTGYEGENLTDIPTPKAKTGYVVDTENWYVDEACTEIATFTNLQASTTVYAKYTANTYTVTYDVDGFAIDGTTIELTYDAICTALDMSLTREDAIFIGWQYNNATYTNESIWNVAENVTITAVWIAKDQVVISFTDTDGMTINKTAYKGGSLTDIPIPKAKTGYTVDEVNWYVDVDCTEVAIFTNLQENITVYAKATANQYTITYNANGGTVANATKNVTYDAAYILETPTHTESYMRFDGWKDGNGNTIMLTGKWTIDSDIVLTAQWTDTRAIFVISFVQAGQETKIFNVKEGESFTDIPTPVQKKGYIVMWDKTEFINVTENITVTAIETAKTYTLILNANGGMVSQATITVTYGQAYELLIPIHTDKMFDCWMLDGVEIADQGIWEIDMAQQELVLTAQWGESEWTEDY